MCYRNNIYGMAVILLYVFLSGCTTKSAYVKYFPLQEKKFAQEHSAKLIDAFDPDALDNNYSVIGYISSEHVLRECPGAFGQCKIYQKRNPWRQRLSGMHRSRAAVLLHMLKNDI